MDKDYMVLTARELIDILSLNPDAPVYALHTQYVGYAEETTEHDAQVVTDGDSFTIIANNYYDRLHAAGYENSTIEDACIYLDY